MPSLSLEQYKNLITSQSLQLYAHDIRPCREFGDFEVLMRSKQLAEHPFTKKGLQRAWNILLLMHSGTSYRDSFLTKTLLLADVARTINCNATVEAVNLALKEVRKILAHIKNDQGLKIYIPRSNQSVVKVQKLTSFHDSYYGNYWGTHSYSYEAITRGPSTTEYVAPVVIAADPIFRNPLTNLSSDIVFALASNTSS